MSSTTLTEVVIAFIALGITAIAAWAEISLVAVSRIDIRRLFDNRLSREDAAAIERTQRLRQSILLIEMLMAGVTVALLAAAFNSLFDYGLIAGLLIALGLLTVVGRMLPRVLASEDSGREGGRPYQVGRALSLIFAPIVRPVEGIVSFLTRNKHVRADDDDEETAAGEANGNGDRDRDRDKDRDRDRDEPYQIEEDEQDMISGVLHLEEVSARQIMVPRIDITAVSRDVLISEAVDVAMQGGHSRIPVYGRNMDEIVGVIYAKDLLRYVNEEHEGLTVEALARPAYFVPESKRVDDLLSELKMQKIHLAVVVDEYGGTAGVVTVEDILEEIVGEIQDEYDRETPPFELISDDEAIVDGRLSLDDLADEMELEWPGPVSGTVGGFIQRQLGRIPEADEVVEVPGTNVRLTVLRVEHRRVKQVRVERVRPEEESTDILIEDADSRISSSPH